ncbi:Hypothetical predicted protein, partial [Pelobates cultripes]
TLMAPSKQLKITDPVCQSAKKVCLKLQDGNYHAEHSPASESPSESDPLASPSEESPVMDKSL